LARAILRRVQRRLLPDRPGCRQDADTRDLVDTAVSPSSPGVRQIVQDIDRVLAALEDEAGVR
jgi:hypothetical protein